MARRLKDIIIHLDYEDEYKDGKVEVNIIASEPEELIRCEDCKHWKGNDEPIPWNDGNIFIKVPCETKPMDFCSMGERKTNDE